MDINKIQMEIQECSSDLNLSLEAKKTRLLVLKTVLNEEVKNIERNYINLELERDLIKLKNNTNVLFPLELNLAKEKVENYILDSDLSKYVKKNKLKVYNLRDFKNYIWVSDFESDNTRINLLLAFKIYETIEELEQLDKNIISIISEPLKKIVGSKLISKTKRKFTEQENGFNSFKIIYKTEEELKCDYETCINLIKKLYDNESIFDETTYKYSKHFIDLVFNKHFVSIQKNSQKTKTKRINL